MKFKKIVISLLLLCGNLSSHTASATFMLGNKLLKRNSEVLIPYKGGWDNQSIGTKTPTANSSKKGNKSLPMLAIAASYISSYLYGKNRMTSAAFVNPEYATESNEKPHLSSSTPFATYSEILADYHRSNRGIHKNYINNLNTESDYVNYFTAYASQTNGVLMNHPCWPYGFNGPVWARMYNNVVRYGPDSIPSNDEVLINVGPFIRSKLFEGIKSLYNAYVDDIPDSSKHSILNFVNFLISLFDDKDISLYSYKNFQERFYEFVVKLVPYIQHTIVPNYKVAQVCGFSPKFWVVDSCDYKNGTINMKSQKTENGTIIDTNLHLKGLGNAMIITTSDRAKYEKGDSKYLSSVFELIFSNNGKDVVMNSLGGVGNNLNELLNRKNIDKAIDFVRGKNVKFGPFTFSINETVPIMKDIKELLKRIYSTILTLQNKLKQLEDISTIMSSGSEMLNPDALSVFGISAVESAKSIPSFDCYLSKLNLPKEYQDLILWLIENEPSINNFVQTYNSAAKKVSESAIKLLNDPEFQKKQEEHKKNTEKINSNLNQAYKEYIEKSTKDFINRLQKETNALIKSNQLWSNRHSAIKKEKVVVYWSDEILSGLEVLISKLNDSSFDIIKSSSSKIVKNILENSSAYTGETINYDVVEKRVNEILSKSSTSVLRNYYVPNKSDNRKVIDEYKKLKEDLISAIKATNEFSSNSKMLIALSSDGRLVRPSDLDVFSEDEIIAGLSVFDKNNNSKTKNSLSPEQYELMSKIANDNLKQSSEDINRKSLVYVFEHLFKYIKDSIKKNPFANRKTGEDTYIDELLQGLLNVLKIYKTYNPEMYNLIISNKEKLINYIDPKKYNKNENLDPKNLQNYIDYALEHESLANDMYSTAVQDIAKELTSLSKKSNNYKKRTNGLGYHGDPFYIDELLEGLVNFVNKYKSDNNTRIGKYLSTEKGLKTVKLVLPQLLGKQKRQNDELDIDKFDEYIDYIFKNGKLSDDMNSTPDKKDNLKNNISKQQQLNKKEMKKALENIILKQIQNSDEYKKRKLEGTLGFRKQPFYAIDFKTALINLNENHFNNNEVLLNYIVNNKDEAFNIIKNLMSSKIKSVEKEIKVRNKKEKIREYYMDKDNTLPLNDIVSFVKSIFDLVVTERISNNHIPPSK